MAGTMASPTCALGSKGLAGRFEVSSGPETGTRIIISLPRGAAATEED